MTWGPLFALSGFVVESFVAGRPAVVLWLATGVALFVLTGLWVYARRRFLSVRVTDTRLWQGGESVALARIVAVDGVEAPSGARVLGGGLSVPRKLAEVPLRLDDHTVVLAWARDGEALRAVLRERSGPAAADPDVRNCPP